MGDTEGEGGGYGEEEEAAAAGEEGARRCCNQAEREGKARGSEGGSKRGGGRRWRAAEGESGDDVRWAGREGGRNAAGMGRGWLRKHGDRRITGR